MLADLDRAAVIAAKILKAIDQMGSKYGLDLVLKVMGDIVWCSLVIWNVVTEHSRAVAVICSAPYPPQSVYRRTNGLDL